MASPCVSQAMFAADMMVIVMCGMFVLWVIAGHLSPT